MRLIIITANVITIGELFAAIQISDILVMPIINVSSDISSFLSAKKLKEKLTEAFESNTNKASPLNTSAQKIKNLVLKNIMVYKNDKTVLNIEELVITRGKKYLILGPNGSGKSTLLNVIAGVEENFNGAIEVNGKPEAKSTRSFDFAYASQHPFLFNDTLINNITLYQKYDRDILEKTLALLGIRELMEQKGHMIYTENDEKLSGGEKQKISLARILLLQKDFLLLDEAKSAMDYQSSINIERYLLSNPDLTLLYVTHELHDETKGMFDHVIELKAQ